MLRLLHTADLHLGARHEGLGEAAPVLRERQHAVLQAIVDLALAERVDAVLVAGDLFDANTASQRTVERVVEAFGRLAAGRIRVVLIPGDHDAYSRSSVYRAYDLPSLVGGDMLTVLTPGRPWVHLDALDAVVVGPADAGSPAAGPFAVVPATAPATTWRVGLLHAAVGAGPGEVSPAVLEASGLDYAALGHAHMAADGTAGATRWAVPGAPEPVAVGLDAPGTATLVTLDVAAAGKTVTLEARRVGKTSHRTLDVDVATVESRDALVDQLRGAADPDLVLDVRLVGGRPDALELEPATLGDALRGAFLAVRVEDLSRPPLTSGALPPPETIAGAFIRNVEAEIAELEATEAVASADEAAELREVLRVGRRLLAGAEVAS